MMDSERTDNLSDCLSCMPAVRGGDSETTVKISELPEIAASDTLRGNDLLFVSMPMQYSVYRSFKIGYNQISSDVVREVSALPNTTFTGEWVVHGRMTMDNRRLRDDNMTISSVITTHYLSVNFLNKLNNLSVDIYEANHMPSFIGQVIFSTSLRTEEKVRRRYGQYTKWEPVTGRFLMSTRSRAWIGQTTGEFETQLSEKDIPNHGHEMIPLDNAKTFNLNWTIPWAQSSVAKCGKESTGIDSEGAGPPYLIQEDRKITHDVDWTSKNSNNVSWRDGRVGVIYGRSAAHGAGGARITPNEGANLPHNNIPPFYTLFAWRRVQ